ncbi:MAG: peptide chain release factor N(5)-glutamine methyltransferase [Pseudomonadota bacterium]
MNDACRLPSIQTARAQALARLTLDARHDVDTLLCDALDITRARLFAEPDTLLTPPQWALFEQWLGRLIDDEPLAYIRGHCAFWSLSLTVSPAVLIPRPDTERLVEVALSHLEGRKAARVLELGTGSGAIALALASERRGDRLMATDTSSDALWVARHNRDALGLANVSFCQSNWFAQLPHQHYDLIVSNPPYIDHDDPHVTPSVRRYEPASALFANNNGLADIATIIHEAPAFLSSDGVLLLEHGWQQGPDVEQLMNAAFTHSKRYQDLAGLDRAVAGWQPRQNDTADVAVRPSA